MKSIQISGFIDTTTATEEMFLRTVAAGQRRRKSHTTTSLDSGRRGSTITDNERRKSLLQTHPTGSQQCQRRQSAIEGRYIHGRTEPQLFDIPELLSPRLSRTCSSDASSYHRDSFSLSPLSARYRDVNLLSITSLKSSVQQQEHRVNFRLRGQLFQTFESTLQRFPDTLLGNKTKRDEYFNQAENCYVFNRCHYTFNAVLFYYQSDGILSRPLDIDREDFIKELEFYQIEECIDARHRQELKMIQDTLKKSQILPKGIIRQFIWKLLEYQEKTLLSKICFYLYLLTSIVAIVIFCAETEPQFKSKQFWAPLETAVNILFSVEYALRLFSAPSSSDFIFSAFGIVDLFAVVPFYCNAIIKLAGNEAVTSLSILTLLRVLRVFKLTRYNEGLRS